MSLHKILVATVENYAKTKKSTSLGGQRAQATREKLAALSLQVGEGNLKYLRDFIEFLQSPAFILNSWHPSKKLYSQLMHAMMTYYDNLNHGSLKPYLETQAITTVNAVAGRSARTTETIEQVFTRLVKQPEFAQKYLRSELSANHSSFFSPKKGAVEMAPLNQAPTFK